MDFRKIFFVFTLLIFGSWGFGQSDVVIVQDTTSFAYDLDDDTSLTANGLVEYFDVVFVQDSLIEDADGKINGDFIVSFDLKSVENFGSVQVEISTMIDGFPSLLLLTSSTSDELVEDGSLTENSVSISMTDFYSNGIYNVSIVVFTSEGSALRVLNKSIIL